MFSISQKHLSGECGSFTEVNSKGTYSWSDNTATLPCQNSRASNASAKCTCNNKVIFHYLRLDRKERFYFTLSEYVNM